MIAQHPLEQKYRLEVQGSGVSSVITEAINFEEAQYKSLAASLDITFKEEWQKLKTLPSPTLALPECLKMYERLCFHKLCTKESNYSIKALSKGEERLSPLLVYEIHLPTLGVTLNGQGYSKEMAQLDCVLAALQHMEHGIGAQIGNL